MKKFIQKQFSLKQIQTEKSDYCPFLCTVSGGQDSTLSFFIMVLFFSNQAQFSQIHVLLEILHCHHFWQVKNFLTPEILFRVSFLFEVPYTFAFPQSIFKNENIARMWRKQIYLRASFFLKAKILFLGQTQTDTLEKNFNNLFRGTSPNSLSKNKINFQIKSNEMFFPRLIVKNFQNSFFYKKTKNVTFFKHEFYKKYKYKKSKSPVHKAFSSSFNSEKTKNSIFFVKNKVLQKKYYFTPYESNFLQRVTDQFLNKLNKEVMFVKKENSISIDKHFLVTEISQSYVFCFNSFESENLKPLSKNSRLIISKIVKILNYPVIVDKTNFSYLYSRNKIRHLFFPLIRDSFNKKFETRVLNFFTLVDDDNKYIEELILDLSLVLTLQEKILSIQPVSNLLQNKIFIKQNILRPIFQRKMFIYNERTLSFAQISYVQNTIFC